MFIKTS